MQVAFYTDLRSPDYAAGFGLAGHVDRGSFAFTYCRLSPQHVR